MARTHLFPHGASKRLTPPPPIPIYLRPQPGAGRIRGGRGLVLLFDIIDKIGRDARAAALWVLPRPCIGDGFSVPITCGNALEVAYALDLGFWPCVWGYG